MFGMQPYFDTTNKTTSKKMEDALKKIKNGRRPNFFVEKTRMTTSKKWKMTSKKKEDKPINQNQPNLL